MDTNKAIMDDIMDRITQTEEWNRIQLEDPQIAEAEREAEVLYRDLGGKEQDRVTELLAGLSTAYSYAAILYGMRVAVAIHEATADPCVMSRYVLKRLEGRRHGQA